MLVITGYMVVGILAWLYGDPRHVLYPRNSTGMFCGIGPNHLSDVCPLSELSVCDNIPSDFSLPGLSVNQTVNMLRNSTSGLVIAMLVSLLFLLLLRFLAGILVWVLIIGVLACGAAFGVWCEHKTVWVWGCVLIILSVVEGILLLVLIFLRTRILIAIALIKESSKAVGHMMSTLSYPLVTFVMLLVCVSYWGITALRTGKGVVSKPDSYPTRYLATSGAPVYNVVALNTSQGDCRSVTGNQTCDPLAFNSTRYSTCPSARCVFIKYNTEGLFQRNIFNLQIYNVIAFLWCVNFVIALGQCTLAGAFASYYWAFHKPADIPTFPLISSFMRAL
ncbi:hypothetical protein NFI96_008265, partial [Prochilodus magdalenae]